VGVGVGVGVSVDVQLCVYGRHQGAHLGVGKVRRGRLHPQEVRVRRVREGTRDGLVDARAGLVEALRGALAGAERLVHVVAVGREEVRRLGVRARDHQGRRALDVGSHAGRDQLLDRLLGRHQHLATCPHNVS